MSMMNRLMIEGTDETPSIVLDKTNGIFEIAGRSLPEDAAEFYKPALDWIEQYQNEHNETTDFVFKLEYANTASSKLIQDILSTLELIPGTKVWWHYPKQDEDMEAIGREFSELTELPFVFKAF